MEQIQIRAQFRFNDGDTSKKPYKWEPIPMDEDGNIEDNTYEPRCPITGAQKAVDFTTIDKPTTEEDLETLKIDRDTQLQLIGDQVVVLAKKAQADSLRESYESPQQAANRQKREAAAQREYLGEKMLAFTEKNRGEMPSPELFAQWQEEAVAESKK